MALEDALVLADLLHGGVDRRGADRARAASRDGVTWVQEQTHRRDRTRNLPAPIRNLTLRLAAERGYRSNCRPLRDLRDLASHELAEAEPGMPWFRDAAAYAPRPSVPLGALPREARARTRRVRPAPSGRAAPLAATTPRTPVSGRRSPFRTMCDRPAVTNVSTPVVLLGALHERALAGHRGGGPRRDAHDLDARRDERLRLGPRRLRRGGSLRAWIYCLFDVLVRSSHGRTPGALGARAHYCSPPSRSSPTSWSVGAPERQRQFARARPTVRSRQSAPGPPDTDRRRGRGRAGFSSSAATRDVRLG